MLGVFVQALIRALLLNSCQKKIRNSGGRFYEIGLVGWAKRSVPIISASTRGIDGHGLSAFAHPTSSDFLGCGIYPALEPLAKMLKSTLPSFQPAAAIFINTNHISTIKDSSLCWK
jgi:hypothetical protein